MTMPPRHGKSNFVSEYFTAWMLGRFPDDRIILASYEADFAATWGRKTRDLLEEWGPGLFNVSVRLDSKAADHFNLANYKGGMDTAGVGGPITGRGADLLVVDDPIKNASDANSKVLRERQKDWWQSTAYTRLEPGGRVIVIQTRWHEDDLAGWLLKEEPGEWREVNLPALAEDDDALGRKPGEALWPERYPVDQLGKIRKAVGPYYWAAMYQQRPSPIEGDIFKVKEWERFFADEGDIYILDTGTGRKIYKTAQCPVFGMIDSAVSTKARADYTAVGIFATTRDADLLVRHMARKKLSGPDLIGYLKGVYAEFKPDYFGVEASTVGLSLIQAARNAGLPIREVKVEKDKVSRAMTAAARMEGGGIYFLKGARWLPELEDELQMFPQAAHDDQVDVLGYAVISRMAFGGNLPTNEDARGEALVPVSIFERPF